MKTAVIGGGSTYTPELIEGFVRRAELLHVDELVLQDISQERLAVVGGLARRILDRQGWSGTLTTTDDLRTAIDGAAAVLVQLRVGGQAARLRDETIPGRYGMLGQETTGPGGFVKALRTVPVVLDIAEQVDRYAAPGAWLVDFTNPVGIVSRALADAGHRAIGLCNVAIGFQRRIARMLGVPAGDVLLDHAGLNHLSWIRGVQVAGRERLPELLSAELLPRIAEESTFPAELLVTLGAIPSYYLRYFYFTDEEVAKQRDGAHRAEQVTAIETELLRMYADPALTHKPELLDKRGGAYYSEAAAALVTSLLTGDDAVHYVDVRNGGTLPGLPADAVVEVPARVDRDGAHPLPVTPLAPEMLGLVQAVTSYESLTISAAVHGSRATARRAMLANPLIRQWGPATRLLDDLIEANRQFLPNFFVGQGARPAVTDAG